MRIEETGGRLFLVALLSFVVSTEDRDDIAPHNLVIIDGRSFRQLGFLIAVGRYARGFDSLPPAVIYMAVSIFVLIILYSLYLEYDRPLLPFASGQAG